MRMPCIMSRALRAESLLHEAYCRSADAASGCSNVAGRAFQYRVTDEFNRLRYIMINLWIIDLFLNLLET